MLDTAAPRLSDDAVAAAIGRELGRQQHQIELIASENIVSRDVLIAQGSVLTNKYAEGYPGKRYYGGCEYVDVVETARHRPREAAVRRRPTPTSSRTPAPRPTRRVFLALLQPGDTHHGHAPGRRRPPDPRHAAQHVAASGSTSSTTGPRAAKRSTTTRWRAARTRHKPKLIIAGASAYPRAIDFERFRARSPTRSAPYFMVDMAHYAGLIAAGALPEPGAARRRRHLDHPQDPARPARRHHPDERRGAGEEAQLRRLPRHPGRPADARHRRQGRGLRARRCSPSSSDYAAAGRRQRPRARRRR